MIKRALTVTALLTGLSAPAWSDDMAGSALRLCEKVKGCALEQIAQEDFTPEMRQMMEPMLDNMCVQVQSQITQVPTGHSLYDPALACMQSMEALSCEALRDGSQAKTPQCQAYEEAARAYQDAAPPAAP